ncbi:MAG: hypothetical protein ABI969_12215 [bacterium]
MLTRNLTLAALALFNALTAGAQQSRDIAPYLMADRAAEIALARTAAPRNVSDSATVLVMTRTGFVEAVKGTNGFTCAVVRSFSGSVDDPNFLNTRVRAPHCFNPLAVRSIVPALVKGAEWFLAGATPSELTTRTDRGYASHEFQVPAAGAMAYMLSKKQVLSDTGPHWMPHLMFYYDKAMPASAWGAAGMTAPIIDGSAGDAHAPVLTLLIPVRQWSDGTPALAPAKH